MFNGLQVFLLRLLRVPAEPEPPAGAPESIRVFRAGPNYLRLRLTLWAIGQSLALAGFIFWFWVLHRAEKERDRSREIVRSAPVAAVPAAEGEPMKSSTTVGTNQLSGKRKTRHPKQSTN